MAEPVAALPARRQPPTVQRSSWDQQPGENARWYARFLRYVALGPSRSLSLLTRGKRNAYPVPAHWPAQASQQQWKDRALAFDRAVKADPNLIAEFNDQLRIAADLVTDELLPHEQVIVERGYQSPDDEDERAVAAG